MLAAVSLLALLAAISHVTRAADIVAMRGYLDPVNGLVQCSNPDDCTVVAPADEATDQTDRAQVFELLLADQATGNDVGGIMQNAITALVGNAIGKGTVPSQSVTVANVPIRNELGVVQCDRTVQRRAVSALSVTVSPIDQSSVIESHAGAFDRPVAATPSCQRRAAFTYLATTARQDLDTDLHRHDDFGPAGIQSDNSIAVRSVSVDRFGHSAAFVRAVDGTVPIGQFPIAGSKSVDLPIEVTGVKSYPYTGRRTN